MQLEQTIKPLNVAAATILIQLLFISLLAVAASLHDRRSNYSAAMTDRFSGLAARGLRRSPLLFIALFSLATLLVSEELYSIWSPIFQGVGINTVSATTSIALVFFLDILLVSYLILCSGGSRQSPFVSALFTLPALAIFLRLPPSLFIAMTFVTAIIYIILFLPQLPTPNGAGTATIFVNISCLALSIFTGYITRPVPLAELSKSSAVKLGPSTTKAFERTSAWRIDWCGEHLDSFTPQNAAESPESA